MFSQSPYLSIGLFPQFCTYVIFWPVIVKYSNTNLHMHIEPPKNILYNGILLTHLSTFGFYLSSSCVPICVIFRWLTYKYYGLLSCYTRFIMFLQCRFIHTCTAVPKCSENYFTTEKLLPWTKIPYTCLIYPVLGHMVDVQPVPIPVIWTVFPVLYLYDFLTVIVKYSNTNLHMHIEPPKNIR